MIDDEDNVDTSADGNDAEWTEIDISGNPPPEPESIEIVTPEDEAVSDTVPEQHELDLGDTEEDSLPELDGIETKGAEKRIRQLVRQRKDREDELAKYKQEVSDLRKQMSEVGRIKYDYDGALVTAKEGEIAQKLDLARNKFREAYDSGARDDVLEAQENISDAQTELKLLNQQKEWIKQQAEQYQKEQEHYKEENETNESGPQVHPLAEKWATKNKWFGEDRTATAVALSIDAQLKEEGLDPSDPDFYSEIDSRLRAELPDKFDSEEATPKKPRQVVAGQSRTPSSKNKVKLTKEDLRLAKKWSIPLERYAAEKAKAEKASGDYTTVLNT